MPSAPHIILSEIYHYLYRKGLRADNTGFFYLSYAILIATLIPDRLVYPSRWIIPAVAEHYGVSAYTVVRNIIKILWDDDINTIIISLVKEFLSGRCS